MKKPRNIALAVTILLLATSACSILPESAPVQLLDPRLPAPSPSGRDTSWTLNITRPDSDPIRDSTRVLVRTGEGQLQAHASARWIAAGPELLRTLLVRHLRDAGTIAQINASAAGMERTLVLDLRRFELAETGEARLQVEIGFEARLYDSSTADLMARELFEGRQPVSAAQPAAILQGFEAVLGEIIPALADWLTTRGGTRRGALRNLD
ncbi:MAG: ABC-type transport auxiliary lipoprotein family protein [Gammaproteobacteria bacterium]|nr:ABC-type transport auxiliary lipoprotein family protein [Gammaproteobacteria bacterium]